MRPCTPPVARARWRSCDACFLAALDINRPQRHAYGWAPAVRTPGAVRGRARVRANGARAKSLPRQGASAGHVRQRVWHVHGGAWSPNGRWMVYTRDFDRGHSQRDRQLPLKRTGGIATAEAVKALRQTSRHPNAFLHIAEKSLGRRRHRFPSKPILNWR